MSNALATGNALADRPYNGEMNVFFIDDHLDKQAIFLCFRGSLPLSEVVVEWHFPFGCDAE